MEHPPSMIKNNATAAAIDLNTSDANAGASEHFQTVTMLFRLEVSVGAKPWDEKGRNGG